MVTLVVFVKLFAINKLPFFHFHNHIMLKSILFFYSTNVKLWPRDSKESSGMKEKTFSAIIRSVLPEIWAFINSIFI